MKNHTNLLDNYQRSHYDTITIGPKGKFHWVLQLINSQKVPEGTDFGQSRFGHPDLTKFGQSNFGQIQFWPTHFWPELVFQWFHNLCGPEGLGPEGEWGPEGWGPKISRFFSVSTIIFALFCLSLGVFSWFFGGFLQAPGRQMCTFGVLGLLCETPAAPKPGLGLHKNHQNSTSRHTVRDKKERNWWRETEKKARKFWEVRRRGSGGGESAGRRKVVQTNNHTTNTNHNNKQQQTPHEPQPQTTHEPQQQTTNNHKKQQTTSKHNNTQRHRHSHQQQHQPQHNKNGLDWPKLDWPKSANTTTPFSRSKLKSKRKRKTVCTFCCGSSNN